MARPLIVTPEAETDLTEAFRWHEERQAGLGLQLLETVENGFASISQFPLMYPEIRRPVRRASIKRFPYGIFYLVEEVGIVVIAVLHQARDPQRWKNRL